MTQIVPHGVSRRTFMSRIAVGSVALGPILLSGSSIQAAGESPSSESPSTTSTISTIVLWMSGGPSTIDIWDPKPGTRTGGPFQAISTSGEGQICEHLPLLAKQMHQLAVIRSLSTGETDHERASGCLRAGRWAPSAMVVQAAHEEHARQVDREPGAVRRRYGESDFGRGCLRARQLVEQQRVALVEVCLAGWDNHHRIFWTLKDRQLPVLDRAMSALVEDLDQRGLWPQTLIVCMGEFGRTPRINSDGGRDHWARAWSAVLGGAGIRGGSVIGQTSHDGSRVESEPYAGSDLRATIRQAQRGTRLAEPHICDRPVISAVFG